MSIPETHRFGKNGFRPYFLTVLIILLALLSFGIGRLTGREREGVTINYDPSLLRSGSGPSPVLTPEASNPESVTASSQGSRYYYSHCGNNISEKNRVTFASAALAESAGYTLAKNCSPK